MAQSGAGGKGDEIEIALVHRPRLILLDEQTLAPVGAVPPPAIFAKLSTSSIRITYFACLYPS